jgi:hypothetical protein
MSESHQSRIGRINRRAQDMTVLGGLGFSTRLAAAQTPAPAGGAGGPKGGTVMVRWLGGGVVELASPDYKQIAYLDAWV